MKCDYASPARIDLDQLDVLHYIKLWEYLETKRFGTVPVRGCDYRINDKGKIWLISYGAYTWRRVSWGQLRLLELEAAMEFSFANDPGKLNYAQ